MSDDSTKTAPPPAGSPADLAEDPALRLRAETVEDLVIFSAVLQDAVTVVADMAYSPGERRFALMLNRYLWEQDEDGGRPSNQRVRSGLHFDGVLKATTRDIPQKSRTKPLELLAIHGETDDSGAGAIYLLFAGGGAIKLTVECVDGYLSDTGEPWPCRHRPCHES